MIKHDYPVAVYDGPTCSDFAATATLLISRAIIIFSGPTGLAISLLAAILHYHYKSRKYLVIFIIVFSLFLTDYIFIQLILNTTSSEFSCNIRY